MLQDTFQGAGVAIGDNHLEAVFVPPSRELGRLRKRISTLERDNEALRQRMSVDVGKAEPVREDRQPLVPRPRLRIGD